MKYCKNCKLSYHTPLSTCMFCNNELSATKNASESYCYPAYTKESNSRKTTLKIVSFILFVSNITCFVVDMASGNKGISWSLYVLSASIYSYIFLHLITKKAPGIKKVFYLFIISILELLSIGILLGTYHWVTDFILPFGIISLNITMTSFLFGKRIKLFDTFIYTFVTCLLALPSLLLLLLQVTKTDWPSIACIIYSSVILIALCYFRPDEIKNELLRRMHL